MSLESGSPGTNGSASATRNDPAAALRAVARIPAGNVAVIAYGVAREGETPEAAEVRLREVALAAGVSPERLRVIVEPGGQTGSALKRRAFRARVLGALDGERKRSTSRARPQEPDERGRASSVQGHALVGCRAPEQARERLADLDARWEDLKAEIDEGKALDHAGAPPRASGTWAHTDQGTPRDRGPAPGPCGCAPKDDGNLGAPTPPELLGVREQGPGHRPGRAVVIDRFDDLGREPISIGGAVVAILARRSHVIIPSEGLDTRTTQGRAVARAVLRLWELSRDERRKISTQTTARLRERLAVYGHTPFGFRRDKDKLIPVSKDLAVVRRMKDLARSRYSAGRTAALLNREKLTGSRDRPWTNQAVRRILRNPIYEKNGA